jgi:hypothetical protein
VNKQVVAKNYSSSTTLITNRYVCQGGFRLGCMHLGLNGIGVNTQYYLSKVSCWSPEAGRSVKLAQWALTTHYLGDLKSVR